MKSVLESCFLHECILENIKFQYCILYLHQAYQTEFGQFQYKTRFQDVCVADEYLFAKKKVNASYNLNVYIYIAASLVEVTSIDS